MTAYFIIEKAAPITQLQDLGRFGHLEQGFSHSGPMDEAAFLLNNRLLGNDDNAPQLEIAPGGLVMKALADCTIAISGAYLNPTLNGKPLINFCAHRINAGDRLACQFAKSGLYMYIAIAGGFTTTPFLGSSSTTKRLNIFTPGELLVNSQLFATPQTADIKLTGVPRKSIPDYESNTIDVLPAYQYAQFSATARYNFCQQRFMVKASDRMGTRLNAQHPIEWQGGEMLSEGIVPGAIQIPPDGQPIVLQKDAQSLGGYPKIGVIPSASRSLLAQMPVGKKLTFRFIQSTKTLE